MSNYIIILSIYPSEDKKEANFYHKKITKYKLKKISDYINTF